MSADNECFKCKTAIPPRPGYVPWCQACALEYFEEMRQRKAWSKRLSAMGAHPGRRTKRAERLRAIRESGVAAANDNGRAFGRPR